MYCQAGFGKCTFSSSSIKLASYVYDTSGKRAFISEVYEGINKVYIPVSAHDRYDGGFTQFVYDIPEGSVLLLQAIRTYRGTLSAEAAIFLRIRAEGPLLNIGLKVPPSASSLLGTQNNLISAFQGRADIVSADEVRDYGIEVPAWYVKKFTGLEEIQECFDILEIEGEVSKRQVVTSVVSTEGGNRITITRSRRNVRFVKKTNDK